MKEAEGCCIERAIESDYIHNQYEQVSDEESRERCSSNVPCELGCHADISLLYRLKLSFVLVLTDANFLTALQE